MPLLQALVRCSLTTLFLGLCLQLITGQDDNERKPFIVKMSTMPSGKSNETVEIVCSVSTQARECIPFRFFLMTSRKTDCYPEPYTYEACMCQEDNERKFYWNFCSQRTVGVACVAEAINRTDLCEGIGYIPVKGNRSYDHEAYIVKK
ncbi:prolactin-inducible protein [Dromiciops gliroides]|uniref:prolactin-inducible protein n=1 Tax=Dromiciops gliroides TaxID=33562 RepID=UPI001CC5673E|nr:prolactin-inducible protein [Dromiciops gliroides]